MKSGLAPIRHRIEYIAVLVFAKIVRILPLRVALAVGALLGRLAWLAGVRKGVTAANLRIAFGAGTSKKRIRTIGRKSYAEMGRSVVDFLRMPVLARRGWEDYIEVEGAEHLTEAADVGKGFVMLSGHIGSADLVTMAVVGMGFPTSITAAIQENPLVDRMCWDIRRSSGAHMIEEKDLVREAPRTLRAGHCLGLLVDQAAGRDGVFTDFFGVPASTPGGPAAFAIRSGAPIIPCAIIREGLRHRLIIEPPMYFRRTQDKQKDLLEPTQYFTSIIEKYARRFPGSYFWMHKRWKTRPSGRIRDYTYENIVGG
jgi:KDO2-lipid IV(A) lauroyltransferase